jgi:hypothetical protein
LSCDGSIVEITDGPRGEPLSVGRKQRTVPIAIKRALWARDGGCAFPGCNHTRFIAAHHVRHWSRGGETSLANTMLLCSAHHRLVHEGGYTIRRDEHDRWYFRRPDGRAIPAHGYRAEDMRDDVDHASDVSAEGRMRGTSEDECEGVSDDMKSSIRVSAEGCSSSNGRFDSDCVREPRDRLADDEASGRMTFLREIPPWKRARKREATVTRRL